MWTKPLLHPTASGERERCAAASAPAPDSWIRAARAGWWLRKLDVGHHQYLCATPLRTSQAGATALRRHSALPISNIDFDHSSLNRGSSQDSCVEIPSASGERKANQKGKGGCRLAIRGGQFGRAVSDCGRQLSAPASNSSGPPARRSSCPSPDPPASSCDSEFHRRCGPWRLHPSIP